MFFRVKKAGPRHYLQIVQNYWDKEKKKSRQRVLATLGRQEQLCANGGFDSLIKSAERFTDKLLILSEHEKGETTRISTCKLGATLVFQRLWKESGCEKIIKGLLAQRHFEFDVEKAVFLSVLHRLFESGSDRQCALWQKDYHLEDQREQGELTRISHKRGVHRLSICDIIKYIAFIHHIIGDNRCKQSVHQIA
jgi:hypothetical protein